MARGRKKIPSKIAALRGHPSKRPPNELEPEMELIQPARPSHLCDEALAEWNRIVPILMDMGILSKADGPALSIYCEAHAQWVHAKDQIRERGAVVKINDVVKRNPWSIVASDAARMMQSILGEFGLTPSSRAKVCVVGTRKRDKIEELLNKQRKRTG